MTNLEKFNQAQEKLRIATTIERNLKTALTGNIPPHKIRKYQPVVTQSYVKKLNANERLLSVYKKLSRLEKEKITL